MVRSWYYGRMKFSNGVSDLRSRRTFLRAGAIAAAATCVSGVSAEGFTGAGTPSGTTPAGFHLGVASYTFRNFTRAQMIGYLKQLHIDTVNLKDVKDHLPSTSPEEEQKALDEYASNGVKVTAAGTIYFPKDEDADIRAKFEYAKRAGIKVIVAGDPAPAVLPRIEKFVKEYDIKFALHNHGPEDKLWHSPLDVLKAVKNMDPRMGCCIDVGHTMRAGTDVVAAIKAVGPRLFDVHMKDLAQKDSKESQVAVGAGIMPIRAIFQQLMDQKYTGNVDLEYEIFGDNPMPGVIESFAYMHGVLAGMNRA
jgi:sugar phosphate isomerase/epimerase